MVKFIKMIDDICSGCLDLHVEVLELLHWIYRIDIAYTYNTLTRLYHIVS